jgi:hypothetical protein
LAVLKAQPDFGLALIHALRRRVALAFAR